MKYVKYIVLLLILNINHISYADYVTTNYNLVIPAFGSRDWGSKISGDIISIDTLMGEISKDTTSYRVGHNTTGTHKDIKIVSNSDQITISADGSNAQIRWSDGDLYMKTDEGTNNKSAVYVLGRGTGTGVIGVVEKDGTSTYMEQTDDGTANIYSGSIKHFTFVNGLVINEDGVDSDVRIEGLGNTNVLFVDASTNRVAIGKRNPLVSLDVVGKISTDALVLKTLTVSPDVTSGQSTLCVSRDTNGTEYLQIYMNRQWKRVSLQ